MERFHLRGAAPDTGELFYVGKGSSPPRDALPPSWVLCQYLPIRQPLRPFQWRFYATRASLPEHADETAFFAPSSTLRHNFPLRASGAAFARKKVANTRFPSQAAVTFLSSTCAALRRLPAHFAGICLYGGPPRSFNGILHKAYLFAGTCGRNPLPLRRPPALRHNFPLRASGAVFAKKRIAKARFSAQTYPPFFRRTTC